LTPNLWSGNSPDLFWLCQPNPPKDAWQAAIQKACPVLGISVAPGEIDGLLAMTLGEGQFGPHHWELTKPKKLFFLMRPFLSKKLRNKMRSTLRTSSLKDFALGWPIEDRYIHFQWEVMRQLLILLRIDSSCFLNFWPGQYDFSLVLTHDVETGIGQSFIHEVADLEESMGFRSSFNFVISDYPIDDQLLADLKRRGFEIGIHGIKHSSNLFSSLPAFKERAKIINEYLKMYDAIGFRSPSTYRQPEWMQSLEIEYDLSFFDTDPWEPIPGGTMCIWPFSIGKFIELPYTLVQDNTLVNVLKQKTPKMWLEKVEFIRRYHGMALINTHPDYLCDKTAWNVYADFLKELQEIGNYWHALPKEVSRWWLFRSRQNYSDSLLKPSTREVKIHEGELII
jgi:peptidoglycan/xylan/chitin deacetylase (PgdA/CDA1 family)